MSSVRPIAPDALQPRSFAFTPDNLAEAQKHIAKYPEGRQASAVMPLLWIAQRQHEGWIPRAAIETIGTMLNMPFIRVFEVATFYTMYNLAPIGKYHIQVCGTTPCMLCGSDEVFRACRDELGLEVGGTTEDKLFTLTEVECLGSCSTAPMIQITTTQWDHYFEDLDYDNTRALLQTLKRDEMPRIGSQKGRISSEPLQGPTTLMSMAEYAKRKREVS
jgi:NADH-quinone oxidoreductase E subunit